MATIAGALTFKKLAAGAAILGLVSVPSLVTAQGTNIGTRAAANVAAAASSPVADASATADTTNTLSASKKGGAISAGASSTTTSTGSVTTSNGTTVPTTTNTTSNASIGFEEAVNTAQNTFASKIIVRATLQDSKTSVPAYLVTFSDGSKVIVDGMSGKVVFSHDAAAKTTTGTWSLSLAEQVEADVDHSGLSATQQLSAAAQL